MVFIRSFYDNNSGCQSNIFKLWIQANVDPNILNNTVTFGVTDALVGRYPAIDCCTCISPIRTEGSQQRRNTIFTLTPFFNSF